MPASDAGFGLEGYALARKVPAQGTIGGSAGDLFADIGIGRDKDHRLALLCQQPGRASPPPVAAFVVQDHRITQPRLAPDHLFG